MEITSLLKVYNFDNKIRLGAKHDGGYVFGDLSEIYDCYISAGVSNEESFSRDFIKKYNMNRGNSFAFDGTIKGYPYKYTKDITFVNKNINSFIDAKNTNLFPLMDKYNNIFLKMDIEGGEYPWILGLNDEQLNKFKQIVIEIHGLTNKGFCHGCNYEDKLNVLSRLATNHYLIHAHGNNNRPAVNGIPDVIELTYINKKYFTDIPELNTRVLPIAGLDFPNFKKRKDIPLNKYPFTSVK